MEYKLTNLQRAEVNELLEEISCSDNVLEVILTELIYKRDYYHEEIIRLKNLIVDLYSKMHR